MNTTLRPWQSLPLVSLFALVACGGDGSSAPPPPVSPPPPVAATLSVSGTAAAGAALAGATIEIKCATGTANATAAADGTFHADITSGALPCALRATNGSTVLHSVAASGGASVVANVTPLTELLAANVAGAAPDGLFTSFDAAAQARVTTAAITQALATVRASLQGTLDLTGVDPIATPLVAAHGSTGGNAADALLDALATALAAAHVSLADLSAVVATASASTPPALGSLAPVAATCATLRSGTYVTVDPGSTLGDPGFAAYHFTIDAQTLRADDVEPGHDPDPITLTPVAGQPCRFTFGDQQSHTLLVGAGGVMVAQGPSSTGPLDAVFVAPAQTVAVSQLAGTWNYMSYSRDAGGPLLPENGTFVIDATGRFTSSTRCTGLDCAALAADDLPNPLVPNPAGGYTVDDGGGKVVRVFPVIGTNGTISMFALLPDEGGWSILTQQAPLTLPTVGDISNFYDLTVNSGALTWAPPLNTPSAAVTAVVDSSVTVTGVDAATHSFTRIRPADQRVDGFTINDPRDGVRYRPAGSNYSATMMMPLKGTGLVVYTSVLANQNFFGISVTHP